MVYYLHCDTQFPHQLSDAAAAQIRGGHPIPTHLFQEEKNMKKMRLCVLALMLALSLAT